MHDDAAPRRDAAAAGARTRRVAVRVGIHATYACAWRCACVRMIVRFVLKTVLVLVLVLSAPDLPVLAVVPSS